jgi:Fic family protein
MARKKPDTKADICQVVDRGESTSLMEPLLISEESPRRAPLNDLAFELAQKSAGFRRSLPSGLVASVADLVRSMNCYYSNLIEGHDTHPIDIERALRDDYSRDRFRRDLQLEAKAHIEVQQWIDGGALESGACTVEAIVEIHRCFCKRLPGDLLQIEDPATGEKVAVVPGGIRDRDVEVGRHLAISPGAVPRFLKRFEEVFDRLGKTAATISLAAAHHRLLWIHPFLDGNGRVARLVSHATLLHVLDTGALWSIARGLARNVQAYKGHLAACDLQRRNDLDGRGNLSEETLADFSRFFLGACIDQVAFMESLIQTDRLRTRVLMWAEEEMRLGKLPRQSGAVLEAALYRGELPRGDVAAVAGAGERQARRIIAPLIERGILVAASTRAPLRLAFPAALAPRWLPGLFPERVA